MILYLVDAGAGIRNQVTQIVFLHFFQHSKTLALHITEYIISIWQKTRFIVEKRMPQAPQTTIFNVTVTVKVTKLRYWPLCY